MGVHVCKGCGEEVYYPDGTDRKKQFYCNKCLGKFSIGVNIHPSSSRLLPHQVQAIKEGEKAADDMLHKIKGKPLFVYRKKYDEVVELLVDVLNQSCREGEKDGKTLFDHKCLSAYENALHFLVDNKIIEKFQNTRG